MALVIISSIFAYGVLYSGNCVLIVAISLQYGSLKISMVDFSNYDYLSNTDICKKLLQSMEKIARYLLMHIFVSM